MPQARLDVTGQLHDFSIDFDSLALTLPGISATAQEEQTTQLDASTIGSGIQIIDSVDTTSAGNDGGDLEADDEVETAATADGRRNPPSAPRTRSRILNQDCCGQIGLVADTLAGDTEGRSTSVDASGIGLVRVPDHRRPGDGSPAVLGRARPAGRRGDGPGPGHHVTPTVGAANLIRIVGPGSSTIAKIDRDASAGTSEDGLIDVQTTRTLGTVQLGGFPRPG